MRPFIISCLLVLSADLVSAQFKTVLKVDQDVPDCGGAHHACESARATSNRTAQLQPGCKAVSLSVDARNISVRFDHTSDLWVNGELVVSKLPLSSGTAVLMAGTVNCGQIPDPRDTDRDGLMDGGKCSAELQPGSRMAAATCAASIRYFGWLQSQARTAG